MKKAYGELLRDPRWQRKRLTIMQRADFACEYCGDNTSTLNVHHRWYEKGFNPWDYPDEVLICVCEDCHENLHKAMKDIQLASVGLGWEFWEKLIDLASEMKEEGYDRRKLAELRAPRDRLDELLIKGEEKTLTYEDKIELSSLLKLKQKVAPLIAHLTGADE